MTYYSNTGKSIIKRGFGCLFVILIIPILIFLVINYGVTSFAIVWVIGLLMYLIGKSFQKKEIKKQEVIWEEESEQDKEFLQLFEELNLLLESMIKTGHIDRKILEERFNLADMFKWFGGNIDDYIKTYIKSLAEKEKTQSKIEEDELLARSFVYRNNSQRFQQNIKVVNQLFDLSPIEFEKWVKVHIFEKEGWIVTETKVTGDGGIDLILYKGDEMSIAQCKRYRGTIGEPLLRDFYGTMMGRGVSRGFFVTTGLYSLSALKFAEDKPIEMLDRRVLAKKYVDKK